MKILLPTKMMKHFFLLVCALAVPLSLGACQEKLELMLEVDVDVSEQEIDEEAKVPDYELIMPLTDNRSPWPQGGDCWGDYFFQFVTNNSTFRVYDLFSKTLLKTVTIPSTERGFVSNCHCNTVCFGTKFYDVDDEFPLLYVSTGYAKGGYTGALVYRIVRHGGDFFITLVQTLKFPVYEGSSWTEFIPDDEYAYLCYTSQRVIYKVKIPELTEKEVIVDPEADALETYQFTPQPDWMATSRNQDRLFYRGKIVFVSGVPQSGEASALVLLNLVTCERERIIDLKKIGLTSESESIFLWNGDLCVAFVDKIVKINL